MWRWADDIMVAWTLIELQFRLEDKLGLRVATITS